MNTIQLRQINQLVDLLERFQSGLNDDNTTEIESVEIVINLVKRELESSN